MSDNPESEPFVVVPPAAADPVGATTAIRPDKPTMGNIVSLSKDDWSAWTGGKPASGWMCLDATASDELTSPNQLRPVHASASQKGYNYRRTGMTTQFTPTSSLVDFQNAVWEHLTDCGMDTIAYLPDPEDSLMMTNVVKSHSRYTVQTAKSLGASQLLLYDKYDKNNDRAAVKYLLSSLTPTLMSKIKEKTEDADPFPVIWLQLIKTIQSTSIERFEDLKIAIKARHPSQYSGENLESLAADFRKDARELTTAGQYDHNLTLTMLKTFLLAGGAGNEDYRFPLRSLKQKLDKALLDIGYKEKSGAQAHMVAQGLTYQDICREAEDAYRTQLDRKEWPPASTAPDLRAPSSTFGNMAATQDSTGITRAEVMNLIQSQPSGQSQAKKGNCHKCGKPGHWANKCPDNVNGNRQHGTRNGNQNGKTRANKNVSWRTTPPPPGTANAKKVKDKIFNWCEKCRRWTTTHTTATHTGGQRRPQPAVGAPQANISTLAPDPSVWFLNVDSPPPTMLSILLKIILSVLFSNTFILLAVSVAFSLLLPTLVHLPTYVSTIIPWSTIISWIVNVLRDILYKNPTLTMAPILWFILLTFPSWRRCFRSTPKPMKPPTPLTRAQRRRFTKLLRGHFSASPKRPNCGIKANKLKRSYPLRLRKNQRVLRQAPSLVEQDHLRLLQQLRAKTLVLEREAFRLLQSYKRTTSTGTVQKGGRMQERHRKPVSRKPPCAPKYCPVPAEGSWYPADAEPWTAKQRNIAHRIVTHVHLACATTLRMALQAPARMRNALGAQANTSPIIWDSGASISISPDPEDFNGTLTPPGPITRLKGIAKGLQIKGQGEVTWAIHDTEGNLRMIKVPAFYVPGIKVRLLSTTSLLQTYQNETIKVESHRLTLSGIKGDPSRGAVVALVNPQNNLPTSGAFNANDPFKAADALISTISEVHDANHNLSESEKELLRWHYRLGHIGFKKIQFLLRTGVLSQTESSRRLHQAACKIANFPKCAACQYGKQHRRPIPGTTPSSVVRDRVHALKSDNLHPGQRVSVDHFINSTKGRLTTSAGKTKDDDMFTGGCIFVDHASGYIHVEMQVHLNSHETLKAKTKFEQLCRSFGIIPQEFLADNSKVFTSAEFSKNLSEFKQVMNFAGVGAHHHNGIAERNIRTIMAIARTMMLHAAVHWPGVADATLWPLAVDHAVFLVNHVPDPRTGLSPCDVFTKTRWEQKKLNNLHVWGCPVYVLDKMISDGRKLPRWTPRSTRTINMGFSPKHSITVPLVLNPDTGYITAQFHVVFDDWFATVPASTDELPNFNAECWKRMFRDSTYQYILDDEDEERLIVETNDFEQATNVLTQQQRVADAIQEATPPQALPVDPPPMTTPRSPTTPLPNTQSSPLPSTPLQTPRESPLQTPRESTPVMEETQASNQSPSPEPQSMSSPPRQLFQAPPTPQHIIQAPATMERRHDVSVEAQQTSNQQANLPPRRSTRQRNAPNRLGYDGKQGRGYVAFADELDYHWYNVETSGDSQNDIFTVAYKASASDPDTLSFDEAMRDVGHVEKWLGAAGVEISALEKNGTWIEVPISEATTRILPGTWVFKRKRTPDGVVFKYKARYCVRGDLQETVEDTFAPVVAWGTVRLFLVLSITLQWNTCTIDFSNAFVQATLSDPVWIHLPRGFRSERGPDTCLQLKKSLYGLSVAPRLWYEHLSEALRDDGFLPCSNDQCLLYKGTILIVIYVDDVGIAYSNQTDLDKLFATLTEKGFTFTKEGTFEAFLGIKFERDLEKGTLTLTQKGLIQKIKEATGMNDSNGNWTPASQVALGIDPDGPPMQEEWSYRSIVGMLLYLSTNTRPDISFAVSQVARFSHNPKRSHATAVKTIVRYLNRTSNKGMIIKPSGDLAMDCYVDADFAGLHGRDPDRSPSSAKSRTGYIITLGGCPIIWKSHLQSEITLSTLEAEYSALSSAMRTLLPLRAMLVEIIGGVNLPHTFEATIKCQVFEDNNGALLLATNQRITNRTKYFQVKWHFFWAHVRDGTIVIVKVDTLEQWADYLTKGLNRESFERVRKLVQGW